MSVMAVRFDIGSFAIIAHVASPVGGALLWPSVAFVLTIPRARR
jgi:hypothetical protein